MSNTLKLTVNKVWFDMIKSGEKKEEYREIKPFWINRLVEGLWGEDETVWGFVGDLNYDRQQRAVFKNYYFIEFKNGYSKNAPTITMECKGIEIGMPEMKWSGTMFCDDEGQVDDCFIIKIGNEVSRSNC